MALAPFLDALLACDLPPSELAAKIKAKLPAGDATELEELIAIARPEKLQAVITAYATALAKAEKADAKRKRDREGIAARRASGDIATRVTSATRATSRHRDSPPAYTSPPKEISEPKKVLKSISTYTLPPDFKLTPADIDYALSQPGWDQAHVDLQFSRFCNHYHSRGERRADWSAAWRSWCTNPLSQPQRQLPLLQLVGGTNLENNRRNGHAKDWRPGGLGRLAMQLGAEDSPETDLGT